MHDDLAPSWLTAAETVWSGHHAALAARMARPAAARLTEEQEALALAMAQRLVVGLGESLPLASEPEVIWAQWENGGMPCSAQIAPTLMARVEEYRWRRHLPLPPVDAGFPLFQRPDDKAAITLPDPIATDEVSETDAAYLNLRIVDAARSTAMGQPLLMPQELDPALRRALMLDIAAQDLALVGDGGGRANDMAQAIDRAMLNDGSGSIDRAAHRYWSALAEKGAVAEAARIAVARRDWLAVVALVAVATRAGFARTAAGLVGASDPQIEAAMAAVGVEPSAAAPLIDALADVPGRPARNDSGEAADIGSDSTAALAARAAQLRDGAR